MTLKTFRPTTEESLVNISFTSHLQWTIFGPEILNYRHFHLSIELFQIKTTFWKNKKSQDRLSKKTNKPKSNLELSLICWTEWYACSHLASRKASIEIQHHNSIRLAHEHSINIYISPVHTLVLTITNSLKSISVRLDILSHLPCTGIRS